MDWREFSAAGQKDKGMRIGFQWTILQVFKIKQRPFCKMATFVNYLVHYKKQKKKIGTF